MYFLKKLNENYFIYIILIFIFLPINFTPQLFDGVSLDYAYDIGDMSIIEPLYKDPSRHFHFFVAYFIYFLSKYTLIPAEIFLDNLTVLILILFCIEIKKYSKIFFNLENKWANLAGLFTAIFPIWHILVDFDIGQYLISIFFLLFGFRNFISKKIIHNIIGIIFIIFSFNVESNLSFVIGLATIYLFLSKINNKANFSILKLIIIIGTSFSFYLIRYFYFAPTGISEGLNVVTWNSLAINVTIPNLIENILNYLTYLFLYIWIPLIFYLHIIYINNKKFLKNKIHLKYFINYFLLIILAGFAIFPYLLENKSSSIFYLRDYYQRHAFLIAPIFGIFFSIMFRDLSKINCFKNKVNLNLYLAVFIFINLFLLNYGNYTKIESSLIRINLVQELKNFGDIPTGNVKFIGKNIPVDFRTTELNHILYKAYNTAAWWSTGFNSDKITKPPLLILNNKRYSKYVISDNYRYECDIYIYLKNDLNKIKRIKKLYIFNYKNYYNIDKIEKNC